MKGRDFACLPRTMWTGCVDIKGRRCQVRVVVESGFRIPVYAPSDSALTLTKLVSVPLLNAALWLQAVRLQLQRSKGSP